MRRDTGQDANEIIVAFLKKHYDFIVERFRETNPDFNNEINEAPPKLIH